MDFMLLSVGCCPSLPQITSQNLLETNALIDLGEEMEGKALCSGWQKTAESALQLLLQFPVGCLGYHEPTTLRGGLPTEPPGKKSLAHPPHTVTPSQLGNEGSKGSHRNTEI